MTSSRETYTIVDGAFFRRHRGDHGQTGNRPMQPITQEPMYIDLDDPAPRWFRYVGMVAALLVIAMLVLPWTVDLDAPGDVTEIQVQQRQVPMQSSAGYSPICQPRLDIPAFAEPAVSMALPSWMRLCDWFAEPATHPVPLPTRPADSPYQPD